MSSQQDNFTDVIVKFLHSKLKVKKYKVFLEGNFLQIDYILEEDQDFDTIIPQSLDELQTLVLKYFNFSQIAWSENLLIIIP